MAAPLRRELICAPAPVLRQVCAPVSQFDAELGGLALEMLQIMYQENGRGLAAPQVGVAQRLFVMDCTWKEGTPTPQVFINPEITARSTHLVTREEGCLSLPGQPVQVTRPDWIEMTWQDLTGTPQECRFSGFEATCAQHEADHLDGILITDFEAAV